MNIYNNNIYYITFTGSLSLAVSAIRSHRFDFKLPEPEAMHQNVSKVVSPVTVPTDLCIELELCSQFKAERGFTCAGTTMTIGQLPRPERLQSTHSPLDGHITARPVSAPDC